MASIPNVPTNFLAQPGNGQVYLQWDVTVGATSGYNVLRSTDSITYVTIATQNATSYYDTTATTGLLYYYQVQAINGAGTSNPTAAQAVTPVNYGEVSLGQIRLAAQQRADMVNNEFVTKQEWNSYINHSYQELYDLLIAAYGQEYYVATPYQFTTDGRYPATYSLPSNFYKLLGIDLGISASNNAWLTLRAFPFAERNRYIYGNTPVSFLGVLSIKYRLFGKNAAGNPDRVLFVPTPASNQQLQIWYAPRVSTLLADSDILDGVSGWDEFVIVDAAIKAMQKEESDVTVLMLQKEALIKRIQGMAAIRDVGMPEGVTDVRRLDGYYFGTAWGDGPSGGN